MHRNKKKGITLTEICVALAVLSIVSLVVVSFAAMATGRGATGTDKLKFMQDIELLEAVVDDWFEAVYNAGDKVSVVDDAPVSADPTEPTEPTEPTDPPVIHTWLKMAGNESITLQYNSQNLVVVFPAEGGESVSRTFQFEVITDVQFEVKENPSKTDEIFFCTVTYVYRQGQNKEVEKNYTFCINPRVGEVLPTEGA
jgi:hypothetical protein